MRKIKAIAGMLVLLLGVGGAVAAVVLFGQMTAVVDGEITAKREHAWSWADGRSFYVDVRYAPPEDSEHQRFVQGGDRLAAIAVSVDRYEQLVVGMVVPVRYVPSWPAIARLEGQSLVPPLPWSQLLPIAVLLGAIAPQIRRPGVLPVVIVALMALAATPPTLTRWSAMTVPVLWLAAVVIVAPPLLDLVRRRSRAASWVSLLTIPLWLLPMAIWSQFPAPAGDIVSGNARVEALREVRRVGGQNRAPLDLIRPLERVELRVAVPGRSNEVIALDGIDPGSAGTLQVGQIVPVTIPLHDPRAAWVSTATRGHRWANALQSTAILAIALVLVVARGRQTAANARLPAPSGG